MNPLPVIVGIGEVLWDVFPDGARFGGAPANFVCSAAGLGRGRFEVAMASAVGIDDLGQKAISALVDHQVNVESVIQNNRPTGQVLVQIDKQGHATYEFAPDSAWDQLGWTTDLERLAHRADVICFGTLGQRCEVSRSTIRCCVSATRPAAIRILDMNVRRPFISDPIILDSLKLANVLKLNDEELPVLASLLGLSGSPVALLRQLADRFSLKVVALTLGADGAVLIRGDEVSVAPGIETDVVDTVGAGDAFTATLAIGLLKGIELDTINRTACDVAAFVCSQGGATPILPDRFAL